MKICVKRPWNKDITLFSVTVGAKHKLPEGWADWDCCKLQVFYSEIFRLYMLSPHKNNKKSLSLLTSNRSRNTCSKWTLPSLIFNVRFGDDLILLAASADIQYSIAFTVSFITSAVGKGIRNFPGLRHCQRKRISSYAYLTAEVALHCIVGVLDIKM